jgi:pyrroloquinoline quinone (PQQ) biosynthesis protein C
MQGSIKEYILEEFGHEQWILEDLEACGVDSAEVVNSQPNFETELLVSYVYDYVARVNPVGFFGMVHVLEGTSTAIASETARLAQEKLRLPDNAFHYLRSHGELDQEHVVFFENLINQIENPEDLGAVIHVANRVFRLYGDVIQSASGGAVRHAA